jgi:hypothetical protein
MRELESFFLATAVVASAIAILEIWVGMRGPGRAPGWALLVFAVMGAFGVLNAIIGSFDGVTIRTVTSFALSAFYMYVGMNPTAPAGAFNALAVLGILKLASVFLATAIVLPRLKTKY